jgi:sugar/nucleoside kinase (ribokinase family)
MYDFIAVGDATLDVFMKLEDASVLCDKNTHECKLELSYADKIPVAQVDFIIGGNAANAAIGAKRLGHTSAFLSTVGDDDTGNKIIQNFHKEGVSTEFLTVDKGAQSNYSVVLNYQAERTILVHHIPREYVWNVQQPPKWFYLTSMGHGFEPVFEKVVGMVRESHSYLAYNPGSHQLALGFDALCPTLSVTNLLFLNREETAGLLKVDPTTPIKELLVGLKKTGAQIIVITDGPKGAYVYDGTHTFQLGVYDGPVVERTGCGDAFATAFTVAIAEGHDILEAMRWGNANSTAVLAQVGPEAGLCTMAQLQEIIAKNQHIQPIAI